eukprot:7003698-Pyramimonas_sp.AAC.1
MFLKGNARQHSLCRGRRARACMLPRRAECGRAAPRFPRRFPVAETRLDPRLARLGASAHARRECDSSRALASKPTCVTRRSVRRA